MSAAAAALHDLESAARPPGPAPTHGDGPPPAGDLDALGTPGAGPWLFEGDADAARAWASQTTQHLDAPLHVIAGDAVGLGGDPAAEATAALRDALFLRVRILRKVFEGRIIQVRGLNPPAAALAARAPPAQVEVTLETDEDRRAVRLEGAFARAFHESGAQQGDIVQIDPEHPLVVIRRDRETSEGRVAEERDLVYHLRLGDIDRAGVPQPAEGAEEPTARGRPMPAVPPLPPILGTGRRSVPDLEAMQATDRWVTRLLGGKGTHLAPGMLLVTDAGALPPAALVVLREALSAAAAPAVVLQSGDAEDHARWQRVFPAALRVGATSR